VVFYDPNPAEVPRMGDVVMGFHNVTLKLGSSLDRDFGDLHIAVTHPRHLAILTPCCSIEKEVVSLAPLVPLPWAVFQNPYFVEDLTRINRLVPPDKAIPPMAWDNLPSDKRKQRMDGGNAYVWAEMFVFEANDLFPKYEIRRGNEKRESNAYMVDFKGIFRVESKAINRDSNRELVKLRLLQLSVQARQDLRDKLAAYFARVPAEDETELVPR
jgi:hypothetical protein